MERVIFHIDLNAFFANAEILLNPELENTEMVVSGLGRRSVITTASYPARKYGIHSGMSLAKALQLCPNVMVVKGNHSFYRKLSNIFINYIKTFTDKVEKASIDECYVDMTDVIKKYEKPYDLAMEIQRTLLQKYHMKCSIGIGANKFLAKMASDMKKPLGITWIHDNEVAKKIWPLPISEMYGIGKRTAPVLRKAGIETIGDLANAKENDVVRKILGKNTIYYINEANGKGNDELELDHEAKSIGQSSTFNEDIVEYDEVKQLFTELASKIESRMARIHSISNHITITIRTHDFNTMVRSKKLPYYISTADEIVEEALALFDQYAPEDPIRLLGISCKGLKDKNASNEQLSLFQI